MVTCFLFASHLNEEGCLSVSLNQQGEMQAPLEQRGFTDIKKLQGNNTTTIVVASSLHFTLHRLELPWLAEKKARQAIPFALEDKLAGNPHALHFSFDKNHYQDGHYLIAVCSRSYVMELIETLDRHGVDFDKLTLDWVALDNNEACVMDKNLLVRDPALFYGSLTPELAPLYLENRPSGQTLYSFANSMTLPSALPSQYSDMDASLWVAKRLHERRLLDICQGSLQHGNSKSKIKRWYWTAVGLCLLWLLSIIVTEVLTLYNVNTKTKEVDTKIAVIYRKFFPKAQQVISPKFRINQLLKSRNSNNGTTFWILLNRLTQATQQVPSTIDTIRFQNNLLQVTVVSKNFDALEALQTFLQKAAVTVRQTQASSKEDNVISTLELSL